MHWQLATRGYYWLVDASTSYDSGRVASSRCQLPRSPIPVSAYFVVVSLQFHLVTIGIFSPNIMEIIKLSVTLDLVTEHLISMSRANTTIGACQIR